MSSTINSSSSLSSAGVAPGVYTSIIPLENYTTQVSGTNALICFVSDQGPDNVLTYLGTGSNNMNLPNQTSGAQSFVSVYGQPNLAKYTSAFGLGSYVGYSYSSVTSSLYCLRVLPSDATYSNVGYAIGRTLDNQLVTVQVNLPSFSQVEQLTEMFYNATPQQLGITQQFAWFLPLFIVSSAYRGAFYNNFQIYAMPTANQDTVFQLQISQLYSNGQYYETATYTGSFNPNLLDLSGNATLISALMDNYDPNVQVQLNEDNLLSNTNYVNGDIFVNASSMYNVIQVHDVISTISANTITDGNTRYFIESNAGGALFGYSGQVVTISSSIQNGLTVYTINPITFNANAAGTAGQMGQVYSLSGSSTVTSLNEGTVIVTANNNQIYFHTGFGNVQVFDPYTYALMVNATISASALNEPVNLINGSDGSLVTSTGTVNTSVATQLLQQAYQGLIDNSVLNTYNYPLDLVFDAGYPLAVKDSIVTLTSVLRQDCLAILDAGKNPSPTAAIQQRIQNMNYNTYFAAMYDPFIQIADTFTGRNIWMTPIWSIAQLYALNDKINNVWFAVAGYTRGSVNNILGLLYQPDLDQYYTNQINPIITTVDGNVIWGQLTTQSYPQDKFCNVNVVRCVLYVQRAIQRLGRQYVFDMDDAITWLNLETAINTFISQVVQARGLYSGSATVTATSYQISRNSATVLVQLNPTNSLDKILVPIYVS